jgi:hypothetical protein
VQEALQHFERAVRVSGGGSVEGRLGAADVRLRVQHYTQAEELFAAVAQVHPLPFVSADAHQGTCLHLVDGFWNRERQEGQGTSMPHVR